MDANEADGDGGYFGPALPPTLSTPTSIGPQLPEKFKTINRTDEQNDDIETFIKQINDKIMPEQVVEGDDVFGPMPCTDSDKIWKESIAKEIEGRASKTKQILLGGKEKEVVKRDAWMTELPPQLSATIGLCSRTFKTSYNAIDSDRSSWTDTPADRERKMKSKDKGKSDELSVSEQMMKAKNAQQKQLVKEFEKTHDRSKSLVETHLEKLKKKRTRSSSSSSSSSSSDDKSSKKRRKKEKKEKKEKKKKKKQEEKKNKPLEPVRRPFDRETDLDSVKLFSNSQRQAIMKQSKELNSKFVHGKSHYI